MALSDGTHPGHTRLLEASAHGSRSMAALLISNNQEACRNSRCVACFTLLLMLVCQEILARNDEIERKMLGSTPGDFFVFSPFADSVQGVMPIKSVSLQELM